MPDKLSPAGRILILRTCTLLLAALMCWPAYGIVRKRKTRTNRQPDTMAVVLHSPEVPVSRKMLTSAFPVKISVEGRVVQIQSDRGQLLPVYTHSGVLFLTARLNKGKNWLAGLPRGSYFINNQLVTIR